MNHLEGIEDAALRELNEEIGYCISKEQLFPLLDRILIRGKTNSYFSYCYYAFCNLKEEEFVLQTEEVSRVKWIPINELIERVKIHDETLVIKERNLKHLEELKRIREVS